MIITNWETIIKLQIKAKSSSGIYILYDNLGICLYVGMSNDYEFRLLEHVDSRYSRRGCSSVSSAGEHIIYNAPQSLSWPVVILEPQDYCPAHEKDEALGWWEREEAYRKHYEFEIIRYYAPIFNGTHNDNPTKKRKNYERWESHAKIRPAVSYILNAG